MHALLCATSLTRHATFYDVSAPLANNGQGYCQHSCLHQASHEGLRSLAKITGKEGSRIIGKEDFSGQPRQGSCNLDFHQTAKATKGSDGIFIKYLLIMQFHINWCRALNFLFFFVLQSDSAYA